jgi:hypothetical protein
MICVQNVTQFVSYLGLVKFCNEVKLHCGVLKLQHFVQRTQYFDHSLLLLGSVLTVYDTNMSHSYAEPVVITTSGCLIC